MGNKRSKTDRVRRAVGIQRVHRKGPKGESPGRSPTGKYIAGHRVGGNSGGRPPGTPNRVHAALKEAILLAAERTGFDGKGKDGLVGYLMDLAKNEKPTFAGLLGKVLPMTVQAGSAPVKFTFTVEEAAQEMQARGIPVSGVFDGPAELLPPVPRHVNGNGHFNGHDEDDT